MNYIFKILKISLQWNLNDLAIATCNFLSEMLGDRTSQDYRPDMRSRYNAIAQLERYELS
ncbi:MAG: hypothetical protein AAGA60_26385 [Cyanobacteria bacterium P01_E01_bin.42]